MNRSYISSGWQALSILVVEILNPLLLISLALFVSVGYILTLLMPVNIDIWALLLTVSWVIPVIPLARRAHRIWRNRSLNSDRVTWRVFLPWLPLLALAPVLLVQLAFASLNSIAHVDMYFSYVIQAYHGSTPLENVFVPGYAANYYWLYSCLLAAIVRLTSVDTYSVFNLLNFAYLLGGLLWLAQAIIALNLAKPRTLYLGILVMFVFGAVNTTGSFSVLSHALEGTYSPGSFSMSLMDGADRRLHSVFPKVYHASGMTPGVAAVAAVLYICVRTLRDRMEWSSLVLLSASGIAALGVMPALVPFIVLVLLGGFALASISIWLTSSGRFDAAVAFFRQTGARLNPLALLIWLAVSLLLSIVLLQYVSDFTQHYQDDVSFRFLDPVNIKMTLAANILLFPLAGFHIALTWRKLTPIDAFLAFTNVLGLILVLSVSIPDQNQYKFNFLLAMTLALSNLKAADAWYRRGKTKGSTASRIYIAGLVVLALLNAAYGLYTVVHRSFHSFGTVSYEGIHVQPTGDIGGRLPAFYWIRDNTPQDAIVIMPHELTTIALLFHERLNYVSKEYYFYTNVPAFGKRTEQLQFFHDPAATGQSYDGLVKSMETELPGRPFYAVVKYSEIDPIQMRERGAKVVFDSPADRVAVYLLNPT